MAEQKYCHACPIAACLWISLWVDYIWRREKAKQIVIKREGSRVSFNKDCIQAAIQASAKPVDKEVAIYAIMISITHTFSLI